MAKPGVRIPPVTLYSEKEEVESAFRKATRPWICYTCKKPYNLLESMGSLECQQHPGFVQEDGVWSCCGKKMYPVRWAENIDMQRMFIGKGCAYTPPRVRGCQPCDHNTSNKAWDHTDTTELGDLSALLPFMNEEFPFIMRKGFDQNQGTLRRCKIRELHVPPELDSEVSYLANDGEEKVYIVTWFRKQEMIIYKDNTGQQQQVLKTNVAFIGTEPPEGYGSMSPTGQVILPQIPQGMELKAVRADGSIVTKWR